MYAAAGVCSSTATTNSRTDELTAVERRGRWWPRVTPTAGGRRHLRRRWSSMWGVRHARLGSGAYVGEAGCHPSRPVPWPEASFKLPRSAATPALQPTIRCHRTDVLAPAQGMRRRGRAADIDAREAIPNLTASSPLLSVPGPSAPSLPAPALDGTISEHDARKCKPAGHWRAFSPPRDRLSAVSPVLYGSSLAVATKGDEMAPMPSRLSPRPSPAVPQPKQAYCRQEPRMRGSHHSSRRAVRPVPRSTG